ncbi:hypothetical protein SADUNF_Sadunf16G0230300 [Salix dunnii]|uniref:Pentatricopeptide repeat-containing protein n=1 Tax=Salix dunnii TaxID=1413687 RepID=A0A835JB79_9ROSI|nr:hypothetical protein SADUNF_Sadunf16G0230300 [Salix dunnii]
MAHVMRYTRTITPSYTTTLANHLKNHRLDQARLLFDKIPSPNIHLYTKMIAGYTRNDRLWDALKLFDKMSVRDVVSWNSIIKGCLDCGNLGMATRLFDEMPEKNVISWTTMINGYLKFGRVEVAQRLFLDMQVKDVAAWNAMVHGYFENGRVEEGVRLFDEMPVKDVISWTSMIGGLDLNGKSEEALLVFKKMLSSGAEPTWSTFACVLSACANAMEFNLGVQVHGHVVKLGCCFHEFISVSLITFYANCVKIEDAHKIFNETLTKNVVKWTALLTGYVWNNKHQDALRVFGDMTKMGVLPNQSTFSSTLNACCGLEALDKGKEIHTMVIRLGFETDVFVGNSLIVMYTECGNVNSAIAVFRNINEKDTVLWNSIIVGSAQHGFGLRALIFFNQMIRAGVDADEITFTGLLSACSRSGMLQKGRCFFEYISRHKSNALRLQHYACMVDILGRCGKLDEAEEFVKNMPVKANSMIWLALLSACRMHSNLAVAERFPGIHRKETAEESSQLDGAMISGYCSDNNLFNPLKKRICYNHFWKEMCGSEDVFGSFDKAQNVRVGLLVSFMRVNAHPYDCLQKNSHRFSQVTGFFDGSPFKSLGKDRVCSDEHIEVAAEAAREGVVLLKNAAKKAGATLLLMGLDLSIEAESLDRVGLIYLLQGDNDKFKLSYGLDILDKKEVEALPMLFLENIIPYQQCHDLNYTSEGYRHSCHAVFVDDLSCDSQFEFEVTVQNIGDKDGSEVVLVYSKPPDGISGTHAKQVVGFERCLWQQIELQPLASKYLLLGVRD